MSNSIAIEGSRPSVPSPANRSPSEPQTTAPQATGPEGQWGADVLGERADSGLARGGYDSLKRFHYFESASSPQVRGCLSEWRAAHPRGGVLALLPERERSSVSPLQALCAELGLALTGAVFPALLVDGEFRSVGVLLLLFDEMPHAALCGPWDNADQAVEAIAKSVRGQVNERRDLTLFLFFDALVPNIATILDGLYLELADRVHYLGVNAGSETFQPMPCLFDNRRLIQGGALLLLLRGHRGGILEHGYQAPDTLITATSTEGNRILEIDWLPAFEAYRQRMQAQYGTAIDRENFYRYAVHFPFGIMRANGEIVVRIPVALEKDGSLFCVGEVPPNSLLALLQAPAVDSVHTVDTLVKGLNATYGSVAGQEVITFYCAGRRLHIGAQAQNELGELDRRSRAARIAGALSLGEIGSSIQGGYPLFHNGTLLCSPWTGR